MASDFLDRRLEILHEQGGFRELPGSRVGTDFWSNDYLGFARLLDRSSAEFETAPGSRLISGDHEVIGTLERQIADFHGFSAALLFGSGYSANTGLLSCIARRTDTVVYDEFIHASTRDGIRLSGATSRKCRHNDLTHLGTIFERLNRRGEIFFLTESRFSMDGDIAPLSQLAQLCDRYGVHLITDEAHSVGIDGPNGAGLVAALGLQQSIFANVVTFGKGLGASGAAVLGSNQLHDYLINFSRPFIFTTAPRPEQVTHVRRAYGLLLTDQSAQRQRLERVIGAFRRAVNQRGLQAYSPERGGPIQLLLPQGQDQVMRLERSLLADGYLVKGIRYPSVARGSERLRICLHAFNTEAEVLGLAGCLARHLMQPQV